ncbi:hypothetical protein CFR73_12845 [Novacetimonas maltaceti]|uniref:Uncharacterized protein n=1 Tax=Novacetimonas maltaceti TaxID=1203393 RepID=A0A2S3VZY6_9PROT|nr:hypothetical protein [Novacetimonas maltaceti]POF62179.1 hypothetical protein KMAL_21930 [Novacetimonas maltaceti]PYD59211.1 hypothetical protein CFR73_12845 [Novacetimonas maltaceti]BCZ75950.1 hypothetical protein [Komagataeibacter phage phiKM1]
MDYDFMDAGQKTRLWCLQAAIEAPYGKVSAYYDLTGSIIDRADRFHEYVLRGKPPVAEAPPAHVHDDEDKQGGRPRPDADAASAPDASAGDAQAESDCPAMPEDKRATIAKSVQAITPVLKMLHFVGGSVEATDTGTRVPRICVILPRNGMRHISAEEKSCFAQIEMALTILWVVGCRCHVETGVAGSLPTVHWTMPAGF